MFKFADVSTSGTALDGTAAGKRQTFGSGGAGAACVTRTKFLGWNLFFVGAVDELFVVQKHLRRK